MGIKSRIKDAPVLTDLLKIIPEAARVPIVFLLLGSLGVYGAEARYMTVDQFTKSYVLDLKSEIRDIQKELRDDSLSDREREMLEDLLNELIDELCYEAPDDPYCEE